MDHALHAPPDPSEPRAGRPLLRALPAQDSERMASLGLITTGSTASSGGGTSGTGGAGGSGGGGPCVPTTETCNGADDDCDGIVDEPAGSAVGPACGCTWSTYAGKLYALCPTTTGVAQSCPGGTDLVVLEDAAEQTFVTGLFTSVHGTTTYGFAYVSLVQSPSSNDRVGGWAWVGGEGMPIPWGNGQVDGMSGLTVRRRAFAKRSHQLVSSTSFYPKFPMRTRHCWDA